MKFEWQNRLLERSCLLHEMLLQLQERGLFKLNTSFTVARLLFDRTVSGAPELLHIIHKGKIKRLTKEISKEYLFPWTFAGWGTHE